MISKIIMFWCIVLGMAGAAHAQSNPMVLATTPALAVLGQELAPNGVTVLYPGPDNENAADWAPDTATLRRYQQADLVLLVGANYAGWVATTALPRARMIDTSTPFTDRFISRDPDESDHQHGPSGPANHHTEIANTFWLDMILAQEEAKAIATAFVALWPEQSSVISNNLANLDTDLQKIHTDLIEEFAHFSGTTILASHPVYQYLERSLGLDIHSFHWEPHLHPSAKEWEEFDEVKDASRAEVMIWEKNPLPETLESLASRNIEVIVISPSFPSVLEQPLRERLGFPTHMSLND